jgi:hypothetical protein
VNRVLVVFSDGLLSELDSARGLVSRSAWIRQAVEDKLMKEAVVPLVPWTESDIVYDEIPIGGGVKESRLDARFIGRSIPTNNEFDAHKAKPKTRRKKVTVGDLESDEPIDLMVALKASIDAKKAQAPARCNRGACTGTINPVSGRCLRCNQSLKESK